ncbi:MAG: diaminopimelate epimerase [Acidobacteria bacterium]|nr:MAG: diaminopimelate epimerase [Acidobacteriota bacterium]
MIPFVKTQALGNDFILVEQNPKVPANHSELAQRICNRYFGIGADGLILWQSAADSFNIRIFNRDGSEAECSGNGLRCVAAYLIESGRWPKNEIRLKTISGLYTLRRAGQQYEADMGQPQLQPDAIPFIPPVPIEKVVDYPLRANGRVFAITACSTGNPHCSLFVEELDDSYIEKVGPLLERHPAFPHRTNVEFIHVLGDREIEVAFWERGVGRTYASGTGSCGATVASILNGKTGRQVLVHTKAGNLTVEWPENGRLKLTSTANIVAEGNYLEA